MAKSKNNLAGLIKQASRVKRPSASNSFAPTDLVNGEQESDAKTSRIGNAGDTKTISISGNSLAKSIKFGSPSSTSIAASKTGSGWTNLLKQTASGGISSVLGGGLGSIGGLGSLVSGILSLFDGRGKKALPALVEFQLPASQDQTLYVNANGNTSSQGGAGTAGATTPTAGSSASSIQAAQIQSAQIVQAVKIALLNSSSLNDVIAEI